MKTREQCNNCVSDTCNKKRWYSKLYIHLEETQELPCFKPSKGTFHFADLISKITISDAKAPVLFLFRKYM